MIRIDVTPLQNLSNGLDALTTGFNNTTLNRIGNFGLTPILRRAAELAPVRTGELARSGVIRTLQGIRTNRYFAVGGFTAEHAPFVDKGTTDRYTTGIRVRTLQDGRIRVGRVSRGRVRGRNFLRQARQGTVRQTSNAMARRLEVELRNAISGRNL